MVDVAEFVHFIRRIAQEVVGRQQFKGTLVCTAYNPDTHAVKGIIQPHGIESGWVPLAAMHVGNGFGILVGPRVGSSDALDGQVFDLHFDGGDPDTLVAHHRHFSTTDKPPRVESGEMLLQHENGNQVFFSQDGSLKVVGQKGSTSYHDPNGGIVHKPGQGQMVMTGGDPTKDQFDFVMTASGPSTTVKAKIG
jgi:hypothetical protein